MINLSAHDLVDSKNKVFNSTDCEWAIYSIDKNDALRVAEIGSGLADFKEELIDDGKILFGIVRVQDDDTGLYKIVLVSFLGEGVPVSSKGKYHQYVSALSSFFKGFHIHIQARSEEDVEPSQILQKIKDASGAKYKLQEMETVDRQVPFNSRKSLPKEQEINSQSYNHKFSNLKVSSSVDTSQIDTQKTIAADNIDRKKTDEEFLKKQQESAARERELERENLEKERIRIQKEKQEHERLEGERIQKERLEKERLEKERIENERLEQEHLEGERLQREQESSTLTNTKLNRVEATALYDYQKDEDNEIDLREGEIITNVVDVGEGWYSGTNSSGQSGLFPGNYVQLRNADEPNTPQEQTPTQSSTICAVALVKNILLNF